MIGKTISHYKIFEKIGEGGMGEVYLAEDLKLERKVAVKFLPQHLTANKDHVERFEREAKAVAALNHPNIVTIHDIIETESTDRPGRQICIVMEYIDGKSLRDVINQYKLQLDKIIDVIIQISDGLAHAHKAGIVHRDIKPENIIVGRDARIRILDFGLAKLKGVGKITKEKSTLGTVLYMSPEQIQGKEVDQRSDMWSLGIVFYELLSGEVPFKGEYESSVHYAILNEEPEKLSLKRKDISIEIEQIVQKLLAKNPNQRFETIDQLFASLQALRQTTHSQQSKRRDFFTKFKRLKSIIYAFSLVLLLGIAYLLILSRGTEHIHITHTSPLTTAPGLEQDPCWSPEGTRISYASDESGNMDIWVRQIAAGQKVNLTKDYTGYDGKPAWSPDGEWIAFVSERNGGGIFMLPALGGIPKQVTNLSFTVSLSRIGSIPDIDWSPGGSYLVYSVKGKLYTISSMGGSPSELTLPPTGLMIGYLQPNWSPDGKRIACTGIVAPGIATSQIWSLHPEENDPLPVTDGRYFECNPVWSSDGKHLFFISDRGGNSDVWWIPVDERGSPTGQASPLTAGAGVGALAISKTGKKLAFNKAIDRSNIWSIPIVDNHTLTLADAVPLTSENNYIESLHISPDGQWIAFDSNRRGNMDIWIMRKDGSELRQLTTNQAHDWYPQWSPDGKKILFHSLRNGNRDLYIIPVGGGALKQLTKHPAQDLAAVWSPDEKKIAFLSNRSGNMDAWLMSNNGEILQQLTLDDAQEFILLWSPDGKQIAFASNRTGQYELFTILSEQYFLFDKTIIPRQITHEEWKNVSPLYWTEDEKTIFAYGVGGPYNQGASLWAVSVLDGKVRPLIDFKGSLKEPSHALASDGKRIYFPLVERLGDLWMAELAFDQ